MPVLFSTISQPVEKFSAFPEELHIFPLHFGREISVICLYWLDR